MALKQEHIAHRRIDENGDTVLQFSLAHAGWIEGLSRTPSTSYAAGDVVICPYHPEYTLECTTAGTTSDAVTIDTVTIAKGDTITDGTVIWTVVAKAIVDASISGKVITLAFADGTTKTLTTQDTDTNNINTHNSTNYNSYSGTGYVVFNNKQCIQWGVTTTASNTHEISFPKAFSHLHAVVIGEISDRSRAFSYGNRGNTGFTAYLGAADNCSWIAIGVVS